MTTDPVILKASLRSALDRRAEFPIPYRHWTVGNIFPQATVDQLRSLPFSAQDVDGVSGRRELHNPTRTYFDAGNNARHTVGRDVAAALQDPESVGALAAAFDVDLAGTYLRIEYATDTDGFWLEPHTDLGVKKLTFLYYLSNEPGHEDLGTDIYSAKDTHFGRPAFTPNSALVFVPADNTWHGFEPRPITGVRKSVIVNYVTPEWRAREQLAFPDAPV
jgi:hypothetical protein